MGPKRTLRSTAVGVAHASDSTDKPAAVRPYRFRRMMQASIADMSLASLMRSNAWPSRSFTAVGGRPGGTVFNFRDFLASAVQLSTVGGATISVRTRRPGHWNLTLRVSRPGTRKEPKPIASLHAPMAKAVFRRSQRYPPREAPPRRFGSSPGSSARRWPAQGSAGPMPRRLPRNASFGSFPPQCPQDEG